MFKQIARRFMDRCRCLAVASPAATQAHAVDKELLDRAADYWGERAQERKNAERPLMIGWLDCPRVVQHYVYPQMGATVGGTENWFDLTKNRYFPAPVARALSLGCGDGYLERAMVQHRVAANVDGVDVSPEALAIAAEQARQQGLADHIRYFVADLNTHVFPPDTYDAVFAAMAVHHVENLEFHLDQIRRTLKPGGLFVMNEFVGPDQFQWTDKQLEMANTALQSVPESYRRTVNGDMRQPVTRPTREEMNRMDPTESIRSSQIVPLVENMFDIVQRVDYGGTLLQLVLAEILNNFASGGDEAEAILDRLFDMERRALESGALSSDFTYMVARKPV